MPKHVDQSGENNPRFKWTFEKLKKVALKCKTKSEFKERFPAAYLCSSRRKYHNIICSHMPDRMDINGENNPRFKWTLKKLREEALKFKTRGEFQEKSCAAYIIAYRKGIEFLDDICSHMENGTNSSKAELYLLDIIKKHYPKTQKLMDRKVKIENMPNIHGFEIDIYVPELRKGIEFDGLYSHSIEGLKRGRPKWSNTELSNYHETKDFWFLSKNIEILHIKEEDWKNNKENCIQKCFMFLNINQEVV
jgi:hypothetical protein